MTRVVASLLSLLLSLAQGAGGEEGAPGAGWGAKIGGGLSWKLGEGSYSPWVRLAGARNEQLFLSVELKGEPAKLSVTVEAAPPGLGLKWRFFRVMAAPPGSEKKWQPDALLPLEEDPAPTGAASTHLWLRLKIPPDCPPGRHSLVLRCTGRDLSLRVPVELQVYRFVLPEDLPLTIFGGVWHESPPLGTRPRNFLVSNLQVLKAYYQCLREYRFNALGGAYPLPLQEVVSERPLKEIRNYEEVLAYALNELKFRYFQIPKIKGWREAARPDSPFRRQAEAFYPEFRQFLQSRGWALRGLNYLVDEPRVEEHEAVYQAYALAKHLIPEVRTLGAGWQPSPEFPQVIDIWAHQAARWQEARDQAARRRGQEAWLYANRLHGSDQPLSRQRLIGWLLYRYDFGGYLFWGVNYWPEDPWVAPPGPKNYYRRGTFIYPHPRTGLPVATTRLEALHRGFQDYLYLKHLEEAVRRQAIPKERQEALFAGIWKITANLPRNPFPVTMEELESLRLQIGTLLDEAEAK